MKDKMQVYERLIMLLIENRKGGVLNNLKQSSIETAFYYSERARSRSFLDILGNNKISPKQSSDTILLAKEFRLRLQIQNITKEIELGGFNAPAPKELEKYLEILNKEYIKTLDFSNRPHRNSAAAVERTFAVGPTGMSTTTCVEPAAAFFDRTDATN